MMRLQLSLNHDVDICLLHIQGPAVGTVQFIYLSQTYGVAVVPVVPVVFTRARSRAVSAVGSVRRPVAGNQCTTAPAYVAVPPASTKVTLQHVL